MLDVTGSTSGITGKVMVVKRFFFYIFENISKPIYFFLVKLKTDFFPRKLFFLVIINIF